MGKSTGWAPPVERWFIYHEIIPIEFSRFSKPTVHAIARLGALMLHEAFVFFVGNSTSNPIPPSIA